MGGGVRSLPSRRWHTPAVLKHPPHKKERSVNASRPPRPWVRRIGCRSQARFPLGSRLCWALCYDGHHRTPTFLIVSCRRSCCWVLMHLLVVHAGTARGGWKEHGVTEKHTLGKLPDHHRASLQIIPPHTRAVHKTTAKRSDGRPKYACTASLPRHRIVPHTEHKKTRVHQRSAPAQKGLTHQSSGPST